MRGRVGQQTFASIALPKFCIRQASGHAQFFDCN